MENLTDAGKKSSARSGLNKLKRIRDEMFKKKHQSLKEDDEANKENQEAVAGTVGKIYTPIFSLFKKEFSISRFQT